MKKSLPVGSTNSAIRRPRSHWEKVLRRMDTSSVHEWAGKDSLTRRILRGRFRVSAVYAFGSFARGAAESGDLDLVLVIELLEGPCPSRATVKRHVLGRPVKVDVFVETPASDMWRREQFPEHRLIWSREQSNLNKNLEAIPVIEGATRLARKTDALPFPIKAFNTTRSEAESLVDAIENGSVKSRIVPFGSVVVDQERWSESQQHIAKMFLKDAGKKTREVAHPVLQYVFDSVEAPLLWHYDPTPSRLHVNDVAAFIGRELGDWKLEHLDVSTVLIVPHPSRDYETAIWRLERGPRHNIFRELAPVKLWCLTRGNEPVHVLQTEGSTHLQPRGWQDRGTLQAYGTERDAQNAAKAWRRDARVQLDVVMIRGRKLVSWICRSNQLSVNGHKIYTSCRSVDTLLEGLTETLAKPACEFEPPVINWCHDQRPCRLAPTALRGIHRIDSGGHVIHGRVKERRTGQLLEIVAALPDETNAKRASELLAFEKQRLASWS